MTIPLIAPLDATRLHEWRPAGDPADPTTTASWVRALLDAGQLDLPLPGRGYTAEWFRALAELARVDHDLARLAEAHTDAQAIMEQRKVKAAVESVSPASARITRRARRVRRPERRRAQPAMSTSVAIS
jgi:hypothetical protein